MTKPDIREFDAAKHLDNPSVLAAYLIETLQMFDDVDRALAVKALRTIARSLLNAAERLE